MPKGKIIVLEGIDKSGKTMQAKLLEAEFFDQGKRPVVMSFPNYENNTGGLIRTMLRDPKSYRHEFFHMVFAANRWEEAKKIEGFLSEGYVIIMNRYYQSNLIYGAVNSLDPNWLKNLDVGLPKEDLTIVLDIDYEGISKRKVGSNVHIIDDPTLTDKVVAKYREIGRPLGWRFVNANKPIKGVHDDIMKVVGNLVDWLE